MLTEMEAGASYADALAEAQRLGFAEADPTDDVSGADAAAKMAILATVAFGFAASPSTTSHTRGSSASRRRTWPPRARWTFAVRLVGSKDARRRPGRRTRPAHARRPPPPVRGGRGRVQRRHAAGRRDPRDHARGPALAGWRPPRPWSRTWSASSARPGRASPGTTPAGGRWSRCPAAICRPCSPALRGGRPAGRALRVAERLATHGISVARLVQRQTNGSAVLHILTHEAPCGRVDGGARGDRGPAGDARGPPRRSPSFRPRRAGAQRA